MNQKGVVNIALVVLVVVLVGVAGYFILRKPVATLITKQAPATEVAPRPDTNIQIQKVQITEAETLNNGLYNNHIYGFQFQVPNTWRLEPTPSYFSIESPDLNRVAHGEEEGSYWEWIQGAIISIEANESTMAKNINDLKKFNRGIRGGSPWTNGRIITVAGEDALIYDFPAISDSRGGHVLNFLHNDLWIRVDIEYIGLDGQKIFNNILSTFKFTK